ncbi:MAG: hypothetical protein V1874_00990 [Spirochaetota bacterium]
MTKRKLIIIIFAFMFICYAGSGSAATKAGVGFILGDPSGFTAKVFPDDIYALDFGIGPSAHDGFYLYADFLRHFGSLFPVKELVFYVGGGAGFHNHEEHRKGNESDHENSLEARMPFGIEYTFKDVPVGIFGEIVPAMEIAPDFDFNIRGGAGARYYF